MEQPPLELAEVAWKAEISIVAWLLEAESNTGGGGAAGEEARINPRAGLVTSPAALFAVTLTR